MEQLDYKREIEMSRTGSLGSSDAYLVERIGRRGISALTATDKYRLGVLTGQAERGTFKNAAMEMGDVIEQTIFNILKSKYPQAISNPQHEDELMSRFYNFHIINHIDIEVVEDNRVVWYEVKASRYQTTDVLKSYSAQLQWHWMILKKVFRRTGRTLSLKLVHYQTEVSDGFNADNINIVDIVDNTEIEDKFYAGFLLLKDYLPTFSYRVPDTVPIGSVEDNAVVALREKFEDAIIKMHYLQKQIDDFKKTIKKYMIDNDISKVYGDTYSVSLIKPTTSFSIDSKRLKEELPAVYSQYLKQSDRAASVKITVNTN